MSYENKLVEIDSIPDISKIKYLPIKRDYRMMSLLTNVLFVIMITILNVVLLIVDIPYEFEKIRLVVHLFLIASIFLSIYVAYKSYDFIGYTVREHDIIYKEGIWWQRITLIPFKRIQHSEVNQGPVSRLFDLSELSIYTAGGTSSDITIPGLAPSVAKKLKQYIISQSRKTDEEE